MSWFGTGRLRVGYAIGDLLPFITAGAVAGKIQGSPDIGACGTPTCKYDTTRLGWTAGAGTEWNFAGDWSAKLEYLYSYLGRPSFTGGQNRITSTSFAFNVVRAGVNLHF